MDRSGDLERVDRNTLGDDVGDAAEDVTRGVGEGVEDVIRGVVSTGRHPGQ